MNKDFYKLRMSIDSLLVILRDEISFAREIIQNLEEKFTNTNDINEINLYKKFINYLIEREEIYINYYNEFRENVSNCNDFEKLKNLYDSAVKHSQNYHKSYVEFVHRIFFNDISILYDFYKYNSCCFENICLLIELSCKINNLINIICKNKKLELNDSIKEDIFLGLCSEKNLIEIFALQKINFFKTRFLKKKIENVVINIYSYKKR